VQLIASGPLGERYATALGIAGISFRQHDADKSVIAGLSAVVNAAMAANPARKFI
jgi:2-keto-3-deoxy-galactonokinase